MATILTTTTRIRTLSSNLCRFSQICFKSSSTTNHSYAQGSKEDVETVTDKAGEMKDKARDYGRVVKEDMSDLKEKAKKNMQDALGTAKDKIKGTITGETSFSSSSDEDDARKDENEKVMNEDVVDTRKQFVKDEEQPQNRY